MFQACAPLHPRAVRDAGRVPWGVADERVQHDLRCWACEMGVLRLCGEGGGGIYSDGCRWEGAGGGSFVRLRCRFYLSSSFGETTIYAYYTLLLLSFRSSENVYLSFPLLAIPYPSKSPNPPNPTHPNHLHYNPVLHRLQHHLKHHSKCAGSTSPPSPADRAAPPSPNSPSPPRTPSSRTRTRTRTTPAKPANTSASPCPRTRATRRCTATAPSAPPLRRRLRRRLLPARRGTGARSGRRGRRGGTGLLLRCRGVSGSGSGRGLRCGRRRVGGWRR